MTSLVRSSTTAVGDDYPNSYKCENTQDCIDDLFPGITILDYVKPNKGQGSAQPVARVTHVVVLVHGWLGLPQELDYIKESIKMQPLQRIMTTAILATVTAAKMSTTAIDLSSIRLSVTRNARTMV